MRERFRPRLCHPCAMSLHSRANSCFGGSRLVVAETNGHNLSTVDSSTTESGCSLGITKSTFAPSGPEAGNDVETHSTIGNSESRLANEASWAPHQAFSSESVG